MAIDFPGSPSVNDTFTSGSLVYTFDGTKWTAEPAGVTGGTKIEVSDTKAEIIDTGTDGRFVVTTEGSERLRVTSAGLMGLGTASPSSTLTVSSSASANTFPLHLENPTNFGWGVGLKFRQPLATGGAVIDSGAIVSDWEATNAGTLEFYTTSESSLSERARIDSTGKLLVGTSSARNNFFNTSGLGGLLQVEGANNNARRVISHVYGVAGVGGPMLALGKHRGNSVGDNTVVQSGDECGLLSFQGSDGTEFVESAQIRAEVDGTPGANDMPGRLVFSTTADGASSPTEHGRINSAGAAKFSIDSGYNSSSSSVHEFRSNQSSANTLRVGNSNGSGSSSSALLYLSQEASSFGFNAITYFSQAFGGAEYFRVLGSGDVQNGNNSYGSTSDIKLKTDIHDASSQWDDIKELRIRKYRFIEGPQDLQIGVIAQEAEIVSPGLVSEHTDFDQEGNELGTTTKAVKYSVLYMKAVKALQEAMERIETLESKVASLESQQPQ